MAEYYLISQLPSLDGLSDNAPLPITEERFMDLCKRLLNKKAQSQLETLTPVPSRIPEKSGNAMIDQWNEGERNLRLALARLRAEKMNKQFHAENQAFSPMLLQAVRTAVDIESPMEAEKFLNHYRLDFLETLRPISPFAEDYIFYYGLKLKLIQRIKLFDAASGEAAYKKIYNSIMNGDRSEVIQ